MKVEHESGGMKEVSTRKLGKARLKISRARVLKTTLSQSASFLPFVIPRWKTRAMLGTLGRRIPIGQAMFAMETAGVDRNGESQHLSPKGKQECAKGKFILNK